MYMYHNIELYCISSLLVTLDQMNDYPITKFQNWVPLKKGYKYSTKVWQLKEPGPLYGHINPEICLHSTSYTFC